MRAEAKCVACWRKTHPARPIFAVTMSCRSGPYRPSALRGLSVPDDVGLIGLNDMEMAGWENIALTTIHQPIAKIVSSAIELILATTLEQPDRPPEARLFPCHVS